MEAPLLRVSRPISACSRCRNAKIKCDGKLPACSACERSNRAAECSSANDQFAKGKERSYVASLESRIERLEKRISQCKSRTNSAVMVGADDPNSKSTVTSTAIGKQGKQRKEVSDVDDLVSDFGLLSVNATARDFHGFTKEMSFARLVLSSSSVENMPRFPMISFPPRNVAIPLIQQYLKCVSIQYPVLSETALFGSLDAVCQANDHHARPLDHWNIRMVLAIALASCSQSKNDPRQRDAIRHVSAAMEQVESVIQPGSMAGIQAILLITLYSLVDPSHFNSWYLIGVAGRVMVDLGLHQDPAEESRTKEPQLELRHRIYQCVYALDRTISVTHIRAFSFSDDSTNVQLFVKPQPSSQLSWIPSDWQLRLSTPSLQLWQFRRLQSSWYQSLFQSHPRALAEPWQSRCKILSDMQHWITTLADLIPPPLHSPVCSEILYSSILLIWPPGTATEVDIYGKALVFQYAVDYADTTWKLCASPNSVFCTCLDVTRALFVGQRLLDVIREDSDSLFGSTPWQVSLLPTDSAPPPVKEKGSEAKIDDAIHGVRRINQILDVVGQRFGIPRKYDTFKRESAQALQILFQQYQ